MLGKHNVLPQCGSHVQPVGAVALKKLLQPCCGEPTQVGLRVHPGARHLDRVGLRVGCEDPDIGLSAMAVEMLNEQHRDGVGLLAGAAARYPDAHRPLARGTVQQIIHSPCFERGKHRLGTEEGTATRRQHLVRCSSHGEFLYSAHCDRYRNMHRRHHYGGFRARRVSG